MSLYIKISKGTEEQKRDSKQVLLNTNEMIKKFEQLMKQSEKLTIEAEYFYRDRQKWDSRYRKT